MLRVEDLEQGNSELTTEMSKLRQREAEQMEFTSRLTDKNSRLQAENTRLVAQVECLTTELESARAQNAALTIDKRHLEEELAKLTTSSHDEIQNLKLKLSEQQNAAETAKHRLDDVEDEMKTLKRRHANNVKDLLRQLQQVTRRMELCSTNGTTNGTTVECMSLGSLGSHGGSCGSLDTAGIVSDSMPQDETGQRGSSSGKNSHHIDDQQNERLMDEIDSLRRALVRKNEKIDFLKDHIDQLIEELHRKSRIIQGYVVRDEGGSLTPEASDKNKAHLMKKGGIMASLYSSQNLDEGMTLNLSLEINSKLQALLEDTLLKNIKLKEGMDTLGKEIDWLKRENSRLRQDSAAVAASSSSSTTLHCDQLVDISDNHS